MLICAVDCLCTVGVFGYMQDYIVRHLQRERDEIEENERLILRYREDTEKMRNEIEQLKTRFY